jgi:hypothetical protein
MIRIYTIGKAMLRNIHTMLAALLVLAAVSGCGDQFWVPGLTLPKQSVAVHATVTEHPPVELADMPGFGPVDKILTVAYSTHDFAEATAHAEKCLLHQGFEDRTQLDILPIMSAAGCEIRGDDLFKATRLYSSTGSPYMVILMDVKAIQSAPSGGKTFSWPGASLSGSTLMTVVKRK